MPGSYCIYKVVEVEMDIERVDTDILVAGGGIAGLMAAIRARECGADVVVAEKSHTLTSGAGGCGNDHFVCYIPEVHGPDIELFIDALKLGQMGMLCQMLGPARTKKWMGKTWDIVKLWDEWGIPMKHDGEWTYSGHAFPGQLPCFLKYKGKYQKKILTEQARKRGAGIMNRTMVTELLGDANGVTGALAIDTREDKLIEFHAKSVFLATGKTTRLFPGVDPAVMNNNNMPLNLTGDGRAMAYRLGSELTNLELIGHHVGLKNFARTGQGSWLGVYRGPDGKPLGPYVYKPDKNLGDVFPEVDKKIFARILESGQGPVYMDCTGISDDHLEFLLEGLMHEGNEAVIAHMKEEHIDLRKNPVEFMSYLFTKTTGQLYCNENSETSVRGLFAAGDEFTHGISAAATFGWFGGEHAAEHARNGLPGDPDHDDHKVEKLANLTDAIQKRRTGYDWKDANIALHRVAWRY